MPTWATLVKGAVEGLVVLTVLVPFAKWVITKLLEKQSELIEVFRKELADERNGHKAEIDDVLVRFDKLHDQRGEDLHEHEKTRSRIDTVGEKVIIAFRTKS